MTDKKHITLTYLNVRESISILLIKLIAVELLFFVFFLLYYSAIIYGERFVPWIGQKTLFLLVFGLFLILKIVASSYVILQWLNEYYEITPDHVLHKQGIIFRKTQHYTLNHIRAMDVRESFLGELFNFATVTLYDIRLNKYLDMYLIHNARRYAKILKELRPQIEMKRDHVWMPLSKGEDILPHEELQ